MAVITVKPQTEVGRRLEKEREKRGLTRDDVPDVFGISKPTYLALMRYIPDVTNRTIDNIAEVLGVKRIQVQIWLEEDRAKGLYRDPVAGMLRDPLPELRAA